MIAGSTNKEHPKINTSGPLHTKGTKEQLMAPFERFSRPPQNTPVDPQMLGFEPEAPVPQMVPQAIPQPPETRVRFLNSTATSAQPPRKPRLKIDHDVDMCILKHVLSLKPHCASRNTVMTIWTAISNAVGQEMPSLIGALNAGSVRYRYKKLMEDARAFGDDAVRKDVEERGSTRKKRKLYDYEQHCGDIQRMCQLIEEDINMTSGEYGDDDGGGGTDNGGTSDHGEDGDNIQVEGEILHVSPIGYQGIPRLTNGPFSIQQALQTPQLNTDESTPTSLRLLPLDNSQTHIGTPMTIPPHLYATATPVGTPHDEVVQLQRQFLVEQQRRNDLMEEDLKWKWEFLKVLKQRGGDDGMMMMLGREN